MNEPSILVTGGSGYIGLRLAEAILKEGKFGVQLYLHAQNQSELEEKQELLKPRLGEFEKEGRLKISGGEISDENAFAKVETKGLLQIVHSAAVTRFNVLEAEADRTNILGSRQVLQFARQCPDLTCLQMLSTVYAAGLRSGNVSEDWLERAPAFSNHYERSKWEAECLVKEEFSELPVNIVRIATLIADDESGRVSQQNAFHNTLKLFYYGLLSLFPGDKKTTVYFVTGDFVLAALKAIMEVESKPAVYHVCHNARESASLEALVDTAFATFENYPDFKIRRVLKPLWSDLESFQLLSDGISSLSAGVMSQAVSSVSPFARQLFAGKNFENNRLKTVMPAYRAPDPLALIRSTASFLADTKWGRQLQNAR